MIAALEISLAGNLAYYGNDVVTLAIPETRFLSALRKPAPNTATYATLAHAVWGAARLPSRWMRQAADIAARLRVKLAPWGFAILCQSRIGYRLIHEPMHAGPRFWRGDEELLLCRLVAEGFSRAEIAKRIPRHLPKAISQKLAQLKRRGSLPLTGSAPRAGRRGPASALLAAELGE